MRDMVNVLKFASAFIC